MLLKGSNNKEDWSELQARFDSLSRFLWDCKDILNETEINSINQKYELPLLLQRISVRMKGKYKENPDLFEEDYAELQSVSTSNETLTNVLNDYYRMQSERTPTFWDQLVSFVSAWLWPIVAGVVAGIIAGIILVYYELRVSKTKVAEKPRRGRMHYVLHECLHSIACSLFTMPKINETRTFQRIILNLNRSISKIWQFLIIRVPE